MTALDELNARFKYVSDPKQYGKREKWRIMKAPTGTLEGDCEDYALTLLWYLSGQSMWKFWFNQLICRGVIWHVKTERGVGHAILYWRGRWVDNIYPYYRTEPKHSLRFPYYAPLAAFKMLLGKVGI